MQNAANQVGAKNDDEADAGPDKNCLGGLDPGRRQRREDEIGARNRDGNHEQHRRERLELIDDIDDAIGDGGEAGGALGTNWQSVRIMNLFIEKKRFGCLVAHACSRAYRDAKKN